MLGALAVTIGTSVFVRKNLFSPYPQGHPLRLEWLVHEFFHVKQEKAMSPWKFLFLYVVIAVKLTVQGCLKKRSVKRVPLAAYVAKHHPFERPAYEVQQRFREQQETKKVEE